MSRLSSLISARAIGYQDPDSDPTGESQPFPETQALKEQLTPQITHATAGRGNLEDMGTPFGNVDTALYQILGCNPQGGPPAGTFLQELWMQRGRGCAEDEFNQGKGSTSSKCKQKEDTGSAETSPSQGREKEAATQGKAQWPVQAMGPCIPK